MTNLEIAAAYLAYSKNEGKANWWAVEAVSDLKFEGRWDDLWEVILAMARSEDDIEVETLAVIAAGPVEDLICKAGPAFIDRILHEATFNHRLARLLTGVWPYGVEPAVRERVVTFCRAFPDPIDDVYGF